MIIRNNNIKINNIDPKNKTPQVNKANEQSNGFSSILNDKLAENRSGKGQIEDIKFSKHAEQRLKARNMELSGPQKEKLQSAVKKAEEKGINDSLVMMDNMAFVVSIKNKTVVTAMKGNEIAGNVFTNIDGAVIV